MAHTVDVRSLVTDGGAGSNVVTGIDVEQLAYGRVLDDAGSATFQLPIDHPSATRATFRPHQREILIKEDGTTRWGGYLTGTHVEGETVQFMCQGFFSILGFGRVTTDLIHAAGTEQFDIAWELISQQQAKTESNWGITRAVVANSGRNRKTAYCCWMDQSIADILQELAGMDHGFDFVITPGKVWTVYPYPGKGVNSGKTLTYSNAPQTVSNVTKFSSDEDGDDLGNYLAATPDENCYDCGDVDVVTDATSRTTYGRREDVVDMNFRHSEVRIDRLNEHLAIYKDTRHQFRVTTTLNPFSDTFDIGDTIALTANYGYLNYSAFPTRILDWMVHVDGAEKLTDLTLDSRTVV